MYCKNCGAQIPDAATFCPSCGTQNAVQQPSYSTPQQDYSAPQQNYYASQQNYYAQPAAPVQPEQPMKWFKFLIYFSLFLSALLNLISGIQMLTGAQYGDEAELVYAFFGSLKTIDVIMGIVLLAIVAFTIYVRFRLSGFKKDGPKLLTVLYIAVLAWGILYIILVMSQLSDLGVGVGDILTPSVITNMLTSVVMVIVNKIYFDKRKHLFVND